MFSLSARKRQMQPRVRLQVEQLEGRALLSSVQPLPMWHTAYTYNWSGYAAETNLNTPASKAVTMVSGSWTVPKVTGTTTAYSSVWVGIDGYSSFSVEQLGTEQDTSRSGATTYYAWWEMYPNPSILISTIAISPGDSISASVSASGATFTLKMTDNTNGESFFTMQTATAQQSSAEWVVEAPSSYSGILPLANFGTATISQAKATINGITGAIDNAAWQNTSIDMVSSSGAIIDQTSGLTDANSSPSTSSFTVTYTGSGSGSGGSGGHGHGHGHGPLQAVELGVPIRSGFLQTQNATETSPASRSEVGAASSQHGQVVLAPAADAFFAPVHQSVADPGQKNWWHN
jgi:hypothetical protein